MLKFGFRKKNLYPLMLLLFIFLRICLDKILKLHPYKDDVDFVVPFLIFFSQSLIGYIIYLYNSKKNKSSKKDDPPVKVGHIELISNKPSLSKYQNKKSIVLIIFSAFFNFIGTVIRSDDVVKFGQKEENNSQLEIRVRSIQIITSALVCYFTLRLIIYKHQKVSLIIISFFLTIIIILELIFSTSIIYKIIALLICFISCLSRSFMDSTEKYLFDFNYINIFLMLIYEGLFGILLYIIYFISDKTYKWHGKKLINSIKLDINLFSFIILIILYLIISGFRNVYRVTTNKYYSPMSRALFESTLDPLLFLYNYFFFNTRDEDKNNWIYFSIVIFCLTIIAFFSLVYNDFIILYCCRLERDTYKGITYRLYSQGLNKINDSFDRMDTVLDDKDEDENEDNEMNIELNEGK